MGPSAGSSEKLFARNPDAPAALDLFHEIIRVEAVHTPRTVDKPLILYGAGNLGKLAMEYLDYCGLPVSCIVDAHAEQARKNPFWDGVPIAYPDEISELAKKTSLVAVCIATAPYSPIQRHLVGQGWCDIVPFYDIAEAYRDRHPLANGWFAGNLTHDDVTATGRVLRLWDDDISLAHHLQFLAWRSLREEWVFADSPVTTHDRYFIPEVCGILHDKESFLDIGAHSGEISIRFIEQVRDLFQRVVAIEPDPANLARLRDTITRTFTTELQRKITILDHVLDKEPGVCLFCDGIDYASQISPLGTRQAPMRTLDELSLEPSFIKLHLEGRELHVLKGGKETLHRFRPIIAATAYHNHLGIWELPLWLMENLEEYRFLLRLHGWCGTGLVIYALPCEREPKGGPQQQEKELICHKN